MGTVHDISKKPGVFIELCLNQHIKLKKYQMNGEVVGSLNLKLLHYWLISNSILVHLIT